MSVYLGIDCGTQSMKAVLIDQVENHILCEHVALLRDPCSIPPLFQTDVHYDTELPHYHTTNGYLRSYFGDEDERDKKDNNAPSSREDPASDLVYTAPSLMFVEALELLLTKISRWHLALLSRVAAISVSGQQHGSVWWKRGSAAILSSLDPSQPMSQQLASASAFSFPNGPIWMDSSTGKECAELEALVGGPSALRNVCGARAFERFTGNQIRKLSRLHPQRFQNTERISLISSFLPSLLRGEYVPIDASDAGGTNLLCLETGQWHPTLLAFCAEHVRVDRAVESDGDDDEDGMKNDKDVTVENVTVENVTVKKLKVEKTEDDKKGMKEQRVKLLCNLLGESVLPGPTIVGPVSAYLSSRFGLPSSCSVVCGSGDNPCAIEGMGLEREGDVGVSLGTSDTVFVVLDRERYMRRVREKEEKRRRSRRSVMMKDERHRMGLIERHGAQTGECRSNAKGDGADDCDDDCDDSDDDDAERNVFVYPHPHNGSLLVAMITFKNGSLVRSHYRDIVTAQQDGKDNNSVKDARAGKKELGQGEGKGHGNDSHHIDDKWRVFNHLLASSPVGNGSIMGVFWHSPDITPSVNVTGEAVYRVGYSGDVGDGDGGVGDGGDGDGGVGDGDGGGSGRSDNGVDVGTGSSPCAGSNITTNGTNGTNGSSGSGSSSSSSSSSSNSGNSSSSSTSTSTSSSSSSSSTSDATDACTYGDVDVSFSPSVVAAVALSSLTPAEKVRAVVESQALAARYFAASMMRGGSGGGGGGEVGTAGGGGEGGGGSEGGGGGGAGGGDDSGNDSVGADVGVKGGVKGADGGGGGGGGSGGGESRMVVTGGAAGNTAILQVWADVFGRSLTVQKMVLRSPIFEDNHDKHDGGAGSEEGRLSGKIGLYSNDGADSNGDCTPQSSSTSASDVVWSSSPTSSSLSSSSSSNPSSPSSPDEGEVFSNAAAYGAARRAKMAEDRRRVRMMMMSPTNEKDENQISSSSSSPLLALKHDVDCSSTSTCTSSNSSTSHTISSTDSSLNDSASIRATRSWHVRDCVAARPRPDAHALYTKMLAYVPVIQREAVKAFIRAQMRRGE